MHPLHTSATESPSCWRIPPFTQGYDGLDRLTSAVQQTAVSGTITHSYAYDRVSNMLSNSAVGTFTYPPAGQPRPHAPVTIDGDEIEYDANGNMTDGRGLTIAYDGENRPVLMFCSCDRVRST